MPCGPDEEWCKKADFTKMLISMAATNKIVKQDCPLECPDGCCPYADWVCCPNSEMPCAPYGHEDWCKKTNFKNMLTSMAKSEKIVKQDCPGTECPGGCC